MTDTVADSDQQIQIPEESLRTAAHQASKRWDVMHAPQGKSAFTARVDAAKEALDALQLRLDQLPTTPPEPGPNPLFELRENPRMLRAALVETMGMRRSSPRLPRVLLPQDGSDEPRVVAIIAAYLDATKSVWSAEALRVFLAEVQREDSLELEEIWALPTLGKFIVLEFILANAKALLDAPAPADPEARRLLALRFKTLREIGHTDWLSLLEPLIVFDPVLQRDPAQAYKRMDFESREAYRKQVARIARYSEFTELQVAEAALALADETRKLTMENPRVYMRRIHIGYYLVDRGFPSLAARVRYQPPFIDWLRMAVRRNADDFYIGGIEILTVLLIAAILFPLIASYSIFGGVTIAFLLMLLPATQGAVDVITNTVTALFRAQSLPKLDFASGIPNEFSTLVAIPTLLMNEKQVRELVDELEIRLLANPDPHLHFALLTDLPDSVTRPRENDTDAMVDLAVQLIEGLNARYSNQKYGCCLLLHRHRIFNARQGVWMGWERKRGKLLDLNKYLRGEFDAFPVKAGDLESLRSVQYIITLDSDTQLPRGSAHQMVGAIAHPLNRAVIDPDLKIVTEGYGILQPRVGVSVHSASRSRLASIYSGQTGFDIYTRAISDVYQDLYGEGIFTGKGIYEVAALYAVLDRRFPRNALLSHDLIEGSYARVGLTTDIEVIDDYPSHYSAYNRRKHRWVRGDWQILQWLFARVPDESGHWVRNPIATISRWKIFDNLRRSLVEPFTFILLLAGWFGLPGGALYWTGVTLFLLFVPPLVQLAFSTGHALIEGEEGSVREAFSGFVQSIFITLINLSFLPHQTLLAFDAIIRSLVRRFITGERLLEWETAAEAETNAKRKTPVDRYLAMSPFVAVIIAALLLLDRPRSLPAAAPILFIWGCASALTAWLNAPPREQKQRLSRDEDSFLHQQALRIWRYFHEFGAESHNFLIPDNVEEEGLYEAARVSPTNLGLLLNARQAACRFGFLTHPEFVSLTSSSLDTIEKLDKLHGNLYNWYDTRTLAPLEPISISSVDSGNLAASLYTLRSGAHAMLREPLISRDLFEGLRVHFDLLRLQTAAPQSLKQLRLPDSDANLDQWVVWCSAAELEPAISTLAADPQFEAAWWIHETHARIRAINALGRDYMPWTLPEFAPLRELSSLALKTDGPQPSLEDAAEFAAQLDQRLARAWATLTTDSPHVLLGEQLRDQLGPARQRLQELADATRNIANEAYRLATEMDFAFLVNNVRQLLSIGYDVKAGKLHSACYDLLASEARIATFIAIAKDEMSQQSWFKLGRTHTLAFGRSPLLSWTGTMFEYLMPALWMRSFPDTLVSRTLASVVAVQRSFARRYGIPWGISESGHSQKDSEGHYAYLAFGIPEIALKWDAIAGPVVSPYSTFLALGVDSVEALKNLRRMASNGWIGAYGFYEAADYSASRDRAVLVREWMAHHQGMSLMAILNLLDGDIVQQWFLANPHLQANELLLHEKPVREATIKAEHRKLVPPHRMTTHALPKAS
jgi:cyclic beta-1,2-glucan synthetase